MQLAAPEFVSAVTGVADPADEFQRAMMGLANIRKQIGEDAFRYLSARLDENWKRLQAGENSKLGLSLGEMSYFLTAKQFKKPVAAFDELGEHTEIRAASV